MSQDKPQVGLIDSAIVILICSALTIFLFWIATVFGGENTFQELPSWIIGSYQGFWTALATGSISCVIVLVFNTC